MLFPESEGLAWPRGAPKPKPQIHAMHRRYQRSTDARLTCGSCRFLHVKQLGGRYFKCHVYGTSDGESSDWRKGWPACGVHEPRRDE